VSTFCGTRCAVEQVSVTKTAEVEQISGQV
jgi:hypothetical protein